MYSLGTGSTRRWLAGNVDPCPTLHAAVTRKALLFFHGLRSGADSLEDAARTLSDYGLDVILPDAPHHGKRRDAVLDTMPDTSTPEGYATLLRILREARDEVPALVDDLLVKGYESIAIGGVSFGAFIALASARVERRTSAIVSILGTPDWTPSDLDPALFDLSDSPHVDFHELPPRPLLLLNGARDMAVRPEGARNLFARLRPIYGSVPLLHREWDCPHYVPPESWAEMLAETGRFLR